MTAGVDCHRFEIQSVAMKRHNPSQSEMSSSSSSSSSPERRTRAFQRSFRASSFQRQRGSVSPTRRSSSSMNSRARRTLFFLAFLSVASSVLMVLRYHSLIDTLMSETTTTTTTLPTTALRRLDMNTMRKKRPPLNQALIVPSPVQYNLFQDYNTNITSWKTLPETQFCGMHARIASQEHGLMGHFLDKNSRVIVTGLLQPLGVALALRLHQECGVSTIIGIDALLPNLRVERMKYMERLAILQKTIPNLPKLIVPEMGLPLLNDIIKQHQPTHFVHLSQQSRHYQENLLSMQQLCDMLVDVQATKQKQLHLVYVSSSSSDDDELSKDANQVLASTYHAMYGISAVGLHLPQIYGYPNDDNSSPMSQLVMQLISGGNNTTTNATSTVLVEKDHLFVDDAVDALIAGMQFQPTGLSVIFIPSNITTSMLSNELYTKMTTTTTSKNPTVTTTTGSSSSRKQQLGGDSQARHWLGWTPSTSLQQGVSKLLSVHLAQKYPYGDVDDYVRDFNLTPSFLHVLPSSSLQALPQRVMFPCASDCSRRNSCQATVFDEVVKVSKRKSHGCKYVVYAVNLWPDVIDLPFSGTKPFPDPVTAAAVGEQNKICRFAFVSNKSPLVKQLVANNNNTIVNNTDSLNGQLQHNNWTLIWVNSDATIMSDAEFTILKLSPKRFFSTSVSRAMYVDPYKFLIPPYEHLDRFFKSLDQTAKEAFAKKEYRSGTVIFRYIDVPPQRPRRVVFCSLEDMTLGEIPPKSSVFTYVQHLLKRDGIIHPNKSKLQAQQLLYSYAAHFVQTSPRRSEAEIRSTIYQVFPFQWLRTVMMVHDFREEESRQLGCELYDEHIYWGNTYLEDLALAYILAKRRIMGQLAPPTVEEDEGWIPMFPKGNVEGSWRFSRTEERLVNAEDAELFLRTLALPLHGDAAVQEHKSTTTTATTNS